MVVVDRALTVANNKIVVARVGKDLLLKRVLVRHQYTGLPVRVAIAPTKCLTKVACELLKQNECYGDVLDMISCTQDQLNEALARVEIEEVWGIGQKYAQVLRNYGVLSAKDLRDAEERWVKRYLTVTGARIQLDMSECQTTPLDTRQNCTVYSL